MSDEIDHIISIDDLKLAPRPSFIHIIGVYSFLLYKSSSFSVFRVQKKNAPFLGASQCGKTETVKKLLLNDKKTLFHPIEKIYYFYEFYQDVYDELKSHFGAKIQFLRPFEGVHFF